MPAQSPRPRKKRILLGACALAAIVAIGGWLLRDTLSGAADPSAGYNIATVQRGTLEDLVTATGTLQPRDYVDVGAQVSGLLNRIHVEVGDVVTAGQLLAEIDPRVLDSRVEATRAQLRSQRAQLLERQANLELAESQARRQRNLMAEDATTRESLQNAEAALRAAHAQIDALKAQIDQTESNLLADEANLEYTRIVAPMAGTVVSIEARQGQTLNANQQAPNILRIADLSTMTVETEVSEADIGRLHLGMDVWFTTLGGNAQRWEGTLRRIDPTPTVTNNVVLYKALFEVPNPDRRLMTQMTAQVFFVVTRVEDALIVPLAALTRLTPAPGTTAPGPAQSARPPRGEGERPARSGTTAEAARQAIVQVLDPDGRLAQREVGLGATSRVSAQIVSGLSEGERVVAGLRAGAAGSARAPSMPFPR